MHLNFLIDKLHKAVSVLFRCTKIRKSKPAWVRFSQSDVNGNNESSMTRCCLVLPSVAEHHCVLPGSLRFTNFLPKSQKQSRLCAICQSLCCECTICPQHHPIKQKSTESSVLLSSQHIKCRRWDLNPHDIATTGTWSLRVCQFRHSCEPSFKEIFWCGRWDLNPHVRNEHKILSLARLPIPTLPRINHSLATTHS